MRFRVLVPGVAALAVLAGGLAVPAAAAELAQPTFYFSHQETPVAVKAPATLATAGDRVFVGDREGRRVLVLDRNGAQVATIADQSVPQSMTPSSDGTKVYVTLNRAVSVLDVATATETARYELGTAVHETAFSNGRMYYSFFGDGRYQVASIDLASEAAPVPALTDLPSVPQLSGTATHLVVGLDREVETVTSYATAADGTVSKAAAYSPTFAPWEVADLTASPDGSRVAVRRGGHIDVRTLPSLAPAHELTDNAPVGAVYSPDGSRLFVGAAYETTVRMYHAGTGGMLWQRYSADGHNGWSETVNDRRVVPGAVAFSPDGSSVYALTVDFRNENVRLFRSATMPGTAPAISLSSQATYGRPTTVTVSVPGVKSGVVELILKAYGNERSLGKATVVNGVARRTISGATSGPVQAYFLGNTNLLPRMSATVDVKLASRVSIAMKGKQKVVKGVHKYAQHSDVRVKIRLEPQKATTVLVTLWKWHKGKWRTDGYTKQRTDHRGHLTLVFNNRVKGKLSFTAYFQGNKKTAESGISGPVFTMAK